MNNTLDGDFWIEDIDFVLGFDSFIISYFRDSYTRQHIQVKSDNSTMSYFQFNTSTSGELNVQVDFYPMRMYPKNCRTVYSTGTVSVRTTAGTYVASNYYISDGYFNNFVNFPSLAAGSYVIEVIVSSWDSQAVKDYAVSIYTGATVVANSFVKLPPPTPAQASQAASNQLTSLAQTGLLASYYQFSSVNSYFTVIGAFPSSGVAYVQAAKTGTCATLSPTVKLYYVKAASPTPANIGGTACVATNNAYNQYNCACNMSNGQNTLCKYAFQIDDSVGFSMGYSYSYSC